MAEIKAFIFGMSLALTIGPIAVLIIAVAAKDGLAAALLSALGAGSADFTLALVAFFTGAEGARFTQSLRHEIEVTSSVVLVVVGVWLLLKSLSSLNESESERAQVRTLNAPFSQTYGLTLINPLGVVAFAAFSPQLPVASSVSRALYFALCLFAGSLAVQSMLAISGSVLRFGLTTPRSRAALGITSGIAIRCYGMIGLFRFVAAWRR